MKFNKRFLGVNVGFMEKHSKFGSKMLTYILEIFGLKQVSFKNYNPTRD